HAGRVEVGFLSAAQIDRFGDLNTTVIGDYARPSIRLPGSGGAPEIAAHAKQIFVVMKATPRSFVERLDFRTSLCRPRAVITDFGILSHAPDSSELTLTALFPDATVEEARAAVGWPLAVAENINEVPRPTGVRSSCRSKGEIMNRHRKTDLPGPKARALIARDAEVVSPSYPREGPLAMSHGRGCEVWDLDGNRFLDFAAGIAVCST